MQSVSQKMPLIPASQAFESGSEGLSHVQQRAVLDWV